MLLQIPVSRNASSEKISASIKPKHLVKENFGLLTEATTLLIFFMTKKIWFTAILFLTMYLNNRLENLILLTGSDLNLPLFHKIPKIQNSDFAEKDQNSP